MRTRFYGSRHIYHWNVYRHERTLKLRSSGDVGWKVYDAVCPVGVPPGEWKEAIGGGTYAELGIAALACAGGGMVHGRRTLRLRAEWELLESRKPSRDQQDPDPKYNTYETLEALVMWERMKKRCHRASCTVQSVHYVQASSDARADCIRLVRLFAYLLYPGYIVHLV